MKKLTMTLIVIAIGVLVLCLAVIYKIGTTDNVATTTETEPPPRVLTAQERLTRAHDLIKSSKSRQAIIELAWIPKDAPEYAEAEAECSR